LNYCLPRLRLDARFMRICKRFTLQFVLIKPLMAITNIIMLQICMYDDDTYSMAQLIVYNLSYSFSLYGLVLFYLATHHHRGLKSRKPLLKFMSIKSIIFATYYQGLLVDLIPGFETDYLESLNNFIFCFEMIFFSMLHIWAFGWFEFVDYGVGIGDPENPMESGMPAGIGAGQSIALNDNFEMPSKSRVDNFHGNAKDAFNMEDVLHDAAENFSTRYEDHVRLENNGHGLAPEDDEHEDAHNPFLLASSSTSRVEPEEYVTPAPSRNNNGNLPQSHPSQVNQPAQPAQPAQQQQQQPNPFKNPFDDDLHM